MNTSSKKKNQPKQAKIKVAVITTTRFLPGVNAATGMANKESIDVKLVLGTQEYTNYLANMANIGLNKAEVKEVKEGNAVDGYKVIKTPQAVINEVNAAMKPASTAQPQQPASDAKIEKLEAMVEKLIENAGEGSGVDKTELEEAKNEIAKLKAQLAAKDAPPAGGEDDTDGGEGGQGAPEETTEEKALREAKESYKAAFGNPPHHTWSVEQINEKIKEFQQQS